MRGIIPAASVPYKADGTVNYDEFAKILDWLVGTGIHGLVVSGGNGDFMLTSRAEKKDLLRVANSVLRSRIPLYAGTGAQTTGETIALCQDAEEVGADGLLVIAPNSIHPTQDELALHYTSVANATDLPMHVYNNPGMASGNAVRPDTAIALAGVPGIVGIKDSSADMVSIAKMLSARPAGFEVLTGTDALLLAGLTYGAEGAVSGGACVIPEIMVAVYAAFGANDMELARNLMMTKVLPFLTILDLATRPQGIREALDIMGFDMGPPRLPILPMGKDARERAVGIVAQARESLGAPQVGI